MNQFLHSDNQIVKTTFEDEFYQLIEFADQRHPCWKLRLFEPCRLQKIYLDNDPNFQGLPGGTRASCPAHDELIQRVKHLASQITCDDVTNFYRTVARMKNNPASRLKIDGMIIAQVLVLQFCEANRPGNHRARFADPAFADIWQEHIGHRFVIDGRLRNSRDLVAVLRKLRYQYFREVGADPSLAKVSNPF